MMGEVGDERVEKWLRTQRMGSQGRGYNQRLVGAGRGSEGKERDEDTEEGEKDFELGVRVQSKVSWCRGLEGK